MAINTSHAPKVAPTRALFDVTRIADMRGIRTGAYRCQCCGADVAYDSLAACCQCSDEFYVDRWAGPALQRGNAVVATGVSAT